MSFKIVFDEKSEEFYNDFVVNRMLVHSQIQYIKDLYESRGYIYQNQIYESYGVEWDPYKVNRCYIYERDGDFIIKTIEKESTNKIIISFINQSEGS